MDSATNIRQWREELGLSQAKLAEITGIPQQLLSAHELGKDKLNSQYFSLIKELAKDTDKVISLAKRKKRYSEHQYGIVSQDPSRAKKYKKSEGNLNYLEDLKNLSPLKSKNGLSAISLFSGCGGMSLGFSSAGINIKGHLELDDGLNAIYAKNFPKSQRIGSDIREVNDRTLEDFAKKFGKIDIIVGGPPCQGFSLAGKRDKNDPRNTLFYDYLRFVDAFRPSVAVLENVRLLTSMKNSQGRLVKNLIVQEFERRGYDVGLFEVNAKEYGIPQHRERVFFIAVEKSFNTPASFPKPKLHTYRSFADACSDLAYLESGQSCSKDPLHKAVSHPQHVINWLWNVSEGQSAHDNEDPKLRPPSGYNTTYKRQIWAEPASTVQTTFGMISGCRNVHPIATRALTIREAARIQSFPDDYIFVGSQGSIRTGIGNAVPPLLAFNIADHLLSNVFKLVEVSSL